MSRTKGAKNKNHKEKPIKEKKKRGRPKKIKEQHQEQHQIVNVNVGSSHGGSKHYERKERNTQPTQISFNPVLSIPNYNYSAQPEINPSIIPNFQNPIPNVQPPINPNIQPPTQREPIIQPTTQREPIIQPIDVQPIVIEPPKQKPQPLPQIILDNIPSISNIHTKHLNHIENIKNQIIQPEPIPQRAKPHSDVTDNTALSDIGRTALIIGGGAAAAAVTGGATAAFTGAGLLEGMILGGIQGGIATSAGVAGHKIGHAIGGKYGDEIGGEIGGIIGGVSGAVTGAYSSNRIRNIIRPPNNNASEETIPLFSGSGNRLGGRSRNRLVQETVNQQGERTQWIIPPEEQPTILRTIKKAAKRGMEATSDTFNSLRQQIQGRISNVRNRGEYNRVPTSEMDDREPPIRDITNEIMPNLDQSARVIQARIRKRGIQKRTRNFEMASQELDSNIAREQIEHQQRLNEFDKIMRQDNAATKLQAAVKQKLQDKSPAKQNAAATKIQNSIRNHQALNEAMNRVNEKVENQATSLLQAAIKRKPDNEFHNKLIQTLTKERIINEKKLSATKIQNAIRNHQAVNEVMNRAESKIKNQAASQLQAPIKRNRVRTEKQAVATLEAAIKRKPENALYNTFQYELAKENNIIANKKMDKAGSYLHFKKERAKSTFRGKLQTNDIRLGSKGGIVKIKASENARAREAVKKEFRQLQGQYAAAGIMRP